MSRSGYTDDNEENTLGLWRANVDRAIRGKCGQAFLREMAAALDAMPVKELVAGEIVRDNEHVCAIGSVAVARGLDVRNLDAGDGDEVGQVFGIARAMACEIAYENDECGHWYDGGYRREETPSQRWQRMRKWVTDNLRPEGSV